MPKPHRVELKPTLQQLFDTTSGVCKRVVALLEGIPRITQEVLAACSATYGTVREGSGAAHSWQAPLSKTALHACMLSTAWQAPCSEDGRRLVPDCAAAGTAGGGTGGGALRGAGQQERGGGAQDDAGGLSWVVWQGLASRNLGGSSTRTTCKSSRAVRHMFYMCFPSRDPTHRPGGHRTAGRDSWNHWSCREGATVPGLL